MLLSLAEALGILQQPEAVLAYPTDTVWGLGCRANDALAVKKIRFIKNRSENKGFIVLIHDFCNIESWIRPLSQEEMSRISSANTTTFVVQANERCPNWLTGDSKKIAFRFVSYLPLVSLLKALNEPIVSTSANRSGEEILDNAVAISELFASAIDGVVAGVCGGDKPSTIIDIETGDIIRA